MKETQTTLGIIAGNGALPQALVETCRAQNRPVCLVGLKGHVDPTLVAREKGVLVRLGSAGQVVRTFKKAGVRDIVFIGGIRRPSVSEIIPDWKALRMLIKVGFRLAGDDQVMKIIISEVERLGFRVVGVDTLMPELLAPTGVYGRICPDKRDLSDIERGITVAKALGQVDVGQAVIVQHGLVLSVEGIEGTAELIKRTAGLKRKGSGGVLVKVAKPQQDRRVDLPAIGPQTVRAIADAGLKGIAVESGSSLLVEAEKTVALADELGIFITGVQCQN